MSDNTHAPPPPKRSRIEGESQNAEITSTNSTNATNRCENSVFLLKPVISSQAIQIQPEMLSTTGKYFVLKRVVKSVKEIEEKRIVTEVEEHFGFHWVMVRKLEGDRVRFLVHCFRWPNTENWSIEVDTKLVVRTNRIRAVRDGYQTLTTELIILPTSGRSLSIEWEELKQYLLVDEVTVEIHVKIKKTTRIYKDNLRSFDDETMKVFSDVVLVVKDKKFFLTKQLLAVHSSYFKALFLGPNRESRRTEIKLTGIDPADIQNYLELLWGDNSIDEITIEGILLVADKYDTPLAARKCEQFLLEKFEKELKKKLQLSVKYNLKTLKKHCLNKIKSIADIRSLLPVNVGELDPSIMQELFKKSLAFHNTQ
ncbi:hypothetical protein GCK72_016137 [Caenorhabditis remanei]|uniref:BTB domain-containing protein n=1 Tax=Caenorhabditis remanei TaxID=31234 RepID=A0A6A5GVZ1_CAERE|nr:hypothetical protein GCK72_016137 [Caenorhabditis remanei]KAF1759670.1 hypothetical protein GCK72_016137 [Caenorhabditis remanei]